MNLDGLIRLFGPAYLVFEPTYETAWINKGILCEPGCNNVLFLLVIFLYLLDNVDL
jgi:hypothetical protein